MKKEPEVPPTTKVSISVQTDRPDEAPQSGSSQQREVPAAAASSRQGDEAMMMIQLLHSRKLQPWYGMVKTFQEMKRVQFSENYPNVFLMVTIQSGQVFKT